MIKGLIVLLFLALSLNADIVDNMLKSKKDANINSQASQKKIDKYSEKKENLYDEYLRINKELQEQTVYNKQLSLIVDKQKKEIPQLQKQIQDIETTNKQIIPVMFEMVKKLDHFVSLDTIFLQRERKERVRKLKDYLYNPNMSIAEQFRTILEGYKIEYSYARTLEAYRSELLDNNKSEKIVDFLRVGRLALYYQTIDSSESGYYDLQSRKWIVLDKKYNQPIHKAIEIARQKISPDFLTLPAISHKGEK